MTFADLPPTTSQPVPPTPTPAPKPPERYHLASAWRRASAGFLDLVLMTLVAVGIGTLFVYNDLYINQQQSFYEVMRSFFVRDDRSTFILNNINVDYWRMMGFAFCTLLAYLGYFTVIPMFTRGRTLFSWLFFMRKVELSNASHFFWHLLLRDLFVWIVPVVMGVILVASNTTGNLGRLFSYFSFSSTQSEDTGAIIVKTIYAVALVISLIQIAHMFAKSKRLSLHDRYSSTAVIVEFDNPPLKPKLLVKPDLQAFPGMGVPTPATGIAADTAATVGS